MTPSITRKRPVNHTSGSRNTKGDLIFYCCLIALPLLQVCIFYFGVNFQSICMAFQYYDADNGRYIFDASQNLTKFANEVTQSGFWVMVKNSLLVFVFGTMVSTGLAIIFSYYIYKRRTLYNVFKFVLFLPSVLPSILLVIIFKSFVSEAVPAYMNWIFDTKVADVFANAGSRFWIITAYSVFISFGSQVLIYTGAMDQIPTEIIEAGKLDGASAFREMVSIIIPTILPTMATFLVASVAGIFTNQNNLFSFLTEATIMPSEKTIGYYMYILVQGDGNGKSGYCYAAFLGLIFTAIAVPLTFGTRKALDKAME